MKNPLTQIDWLSDPSHLELAKIVERIVRPVPAIGAGKRKMREELLVHLTAIYDEELGKHGDPASALQATSERFGDRAELSRELQDSQPLATRIEYRLERQFGWRAEESAGQFSRRLAIFSLVLLLADGVLSVAIATWRDDFHDALIRVRPILAMPVFLPAGQFLALWLHFMVRDMMWGAFGRQQSPARAALMSVVMAISLFGCGLGYALTLGNAGGAMGILASSGGIALLAAGMSYLAARTQGQGEIADAAWDRLDIA